MSKSTVPKKKTPPKSKKSAKPQTPALPVNPKEFKSIRAAILTAMTVLGGAEKLKLAESMTIATAIKPATKFNKWHLYHYRKIWKQDNWKNLPDEA